MQLNIISISAAFAYYRQRTLKQQIHSILDTKTLEIEINTAENTADSKLPEIELQIKPQF